MHAYRTHSCADLRASDVGSTVRLSGWIHRKRDHGGVLFVDLRDHYGLTQVVAAAGSEALKALDALRAESVVTITGQVVAREGGAVNPKLATGEWIGSFALTEPQSGSDAAGLQTRAERKGDSYIVTGHKIFITNAPRAHHFVTFARTTAGISAFIIDADCPGVSIGQVWRPDGAQPPAARA